MSGFIKTDKASDQSALLKAIEFILADPAEVQQSALQIKTHYAAQHTSERSATEVNTEVCNKIITNYANYSAVTGSATALVGVVPGFGTVLASFGGATAGAALSMKYHIEMTMAIAAIYGNDVTQAAAKQACLVVAGLGAISEMEQSDSGTAGPTVFAAAIRQHLETLSPDMLREIFGKVGKMLARNAAKKALPFGIGVAMDFSSRKKLMRQAGVKARDFFSTTKSVM